MSIARPSFDRQKWRTRGRGRGGLQLFSCISPQFESLIRTRWSYGSGGRRCLNGRASRHRPFTLGFDFKNQRLYLDIHFRFATGISSPPIHAVTTGRSLEASGIASLLAPGAGSILWLHR